MRKANLGAVIVALLVVLLGIGIWFGLSYNTLVKKEERVRSAWSQVESNIQRKADLLPQLYNVVQRYMEHEKELYEKVARLRSSALAQKNADPAAANRLKGEVDALALRLFAVAERYPELRSSEQFLQLQSQIEGSENRINIARMAYNEAVRDYNGYLRSFPANIVASVAGFGQKPYFEATDKATPRGF